MSQWHEVLPNRAGATAHRHLASILKESVTAWTEQADVRRFWESFTLGIEALADDVRQKWIQYLFRRLGNNRSPRDSSFSQVSPISGDHQSAASDDDYLICQQIMNGASIGLTSVVAGVNLVAGFLTTKNGNVLARRWKKHLCPFFATLSVANKYNLTSIKPGTSLLQSLAFFTEELKRFSGITVPASTSRRFALISDASLEGLGAILCEVSRNNITSGFALNPSRVWWFNLFHTDDPTSWQRVTQFCTAGDRGQVESKDINVLEMLAATKAIHAVQTILADEDEHNTVGYVQLHMFLDNLSMVHVFNDWKSSSPQIQQLLFSVEAWEACVSAIHLPSQLNVIADFLSRHPHSVVASSFPSTWTELIW
ncbi:hypothetical protein FOZ60_000563 [Perkinsus olseni]|uniref:Uncharacterized protein n=1 Tax=Perkinsus olseni TaxID=32597 RepID=A0A7J6MYI8_PEROL|nr:hypothetical protein FOZ60_000563 [Perkinsus olseni]